MTDRQWFGDLSLAILLALPLLALARPLTADHHAPTSNVQLSSAERVPVAGRIGLLS